MSSTLAGAAAERIDAGACARHCVNAMAYALDADDLAVDRGADVTRPYVLCGGPLDGATRVCHVRAIAHVTVDPPPPAATERVLHYHRTAKAVMEYEGASRTMDEAFDREFPGDGWKEG